MQICETQKLCTLSKKRLAQRMEKVWRLRAYISRIKKRGCILLNPSKSSENGIQTYSLENVILVPKVSTFPFKSKNCRL